MKQKIKHLLIGSILACYWACQSDSNCGDNFADFARFNIVYIDEAGEEKDSISQYSVYNTPQIDIPNTIVFSEINNNNNNAFAFSPAHDTLEYILTGFDADSVPNIMDTVRFTYRKINRVDSPDCPIDFSFTDLEVIYHTFDSAAVVNTNLTLQNNAPNIKFYIF